MSTLAQLVTDNPDRPFEAEFAGVVYCFNRIKKADDSLAQMNRREDGVVVELPISGDGWELYSEPVNLDDEKSEAKAGLDHASQNKRATYLTPGQDLTYSNKKKEAEAFKAAGYPENELDAGPKFPGAWPYVSSYKIAEGLPNGQAAADTILGMVAALSALDAEIENARLKGKKVIGEATTPEGVIQARDDALAELEAVGVA